MVTRSRRAALLSLVAAGLLAAPAQATLVYDTGLTRPHVWSAHDDGSGARLLAGGSDPRISPDGTLVAYEVETKGFRPDLRIVPADGSAPPRTLARSWRETDTFAWSPDSRMIAAVVGFTATA